MLSLNVEEYEEVILTTKEKRMEIGGTKGKYSRRSDKITGEGKQNKQEN
jgi:hypothetical protein